MSQAATLSELGLLLDVLGRAVAARSKEKGFEAVQPEAFGLARALAARAAADALDAWARRHGEHERAIAAQGVASAALEIDRWAQSVPLALGDHGLSTPSKTWIRDTLSGDVSGALGAAIIARESDPAGALGLAEMPAMIRSEFARFADAEVAPRAEHIHRHDALIPEALLKSMGQLGVFGISIPEEYGGNFVDHQTMIIATEELSRGSLGAGGSVITRPEICAKAILKGGTPEQRTYWLPRLASGKTLISVAVTEPDAGSDVARVKLAAKKVDGGYVLNGEKTWCTFAGRADVLCVLARTGRIEDGHKGLTLFLVEKSRHTSEDIGESAAHAAAHLRPDQRFDYVQPEFTLTSGGTHPGGRLDGTAIPTIGYRGMHSFSVSFEDVFVPDSHRIGDEGQGFYLQMAGFAGGRIQTAARAVGVMEAAFRAALSYVRDRKVFGKPLADYPLTRVKLAEMAARIQASRQLAYAVGQKMDQGGGDMEASLVKLLSCKDAEWVTREAMQLHGGMGYSEEYAVSRYYQDARVLSIFEGAEEVLALMVVARPYLAGLT